MANAEITTGQTSHIRDSKHDRLQEHQRGHDSLSDKFQDYRLQTAQRDKAAAKISPKVSGSSSIHELIEAHVFKELGSHGRGKATDANEATEKRTRPVQSIKVIYNTDEGSKRPHTPASFHIDRHGTIQVLANPDKHDNSTLVVSVERPVGHLGQPSAAEQKSLNSLVAYLSDHFQVADASKKFHRPLIDDKMEIIGDKEKQGLNVLKQPQDSFPNHTKEAIERIHRFDGAGKGHLSSHQLDAYFPDGKASGNGETRAYKDVIAGMANASSEHPYTAVGTVGEGKVGVGRYLLSYDLLNTWLDKHPSERAAFEARPQFVQLMQALKNNQQPQASMIEQALPESTQEQIASDLIDQFAPRLQDSAGGTDAAKLALTFYLGHLPDDQEDADPANKSFLTAAKRLTSLSVAKTLYPDQGFDFQESDDNGCSSLALKLAVAAERQSNGSRAHGSCSRYVRLAFDSVDPSLNKLFSRYAKDDHLGDDSRFRQICSSQSELASTQLKPGDTIIYGPKIGTNSAGHIETMGLDHLMHSDFSHKLTAHFASEYQWLKVYRPVV